MTEELCIGQLFAGYRIEAVAGRGGMGIVYRATEVDRGRTVALKLIAVKGASDSAFRERLERESELLASIDHPNVITFYEAGEADGQLFIAMRYVEGPDLRSLITEHGRLAPEQAARIVAQVAAGLDAAHANGLVHRDVTPANVLIERRDGMERAYLSDFGLTKNVNLATKITRSGDWVGTLDYVAPEQIEGRRVDARTDVYALGGVLFEALTGRVAYVRESDPAKLWAHLHAAPPSACELRPDLPAEADRVIARAMAKDPAQRFPSAGDLGRAAISAAGGEALTEPGHSVAKGAAAPAATDGVPPHAFVGVGGPRESRRLRRPVAAAVICMVLLVAAAAAVAITDGRPPEERQPRVDHISFGGLAIPSKIVADANGAYVLDGFDGTVIKVDRTSGQIGGRVRVGKSPTDIAADHYDDRVWVLNSTEKTISEIDPRRGKLVGRAFRGPPSSSSLAVLDDGLVVLSKPVTGGDRLLRVDKQSRRRIGAVVDLAGTITGDLSTGGPGVVLTTLAPASITTYNSRLKRAAEVSLVTSQQGGTPIEAVVDDKSRVAWVLFSVRSPTDLRDDLPGVVLRIDTTNGNQIGGPIKVGRGSYHLAIDRGVVWVPSTKENSVTRIDARSGRVIGKAIEVGKTNGDVAAGGGVAWVAGEKDLIRIMPR